MYIIYLCVCEQDRVGQCMNSGIVRLYWYFHNGIELLLSFQWSIHMFNGSKQALNNFKG